MKSVTLNLETSKWPFRALGKLAGIVMFAIALPLSKANATLTVDGVNDFLPTYGGPHGGDLDVLTSDVVLVNDNFIFSATMNGLIGSTPGFYVWGVNRGAGASTSNFNSLGLPGVIFDSILVVNQDGSGRVATLGVGGLTTQFTAGSFVISGNSFTAQIASSLLPSRGFAFSEYTQNLWPRFNGPVAAGMTPISDFSPNASMASVTVPEPATLSLMGFGLLMIGMLKRKIA
jgi:PEP-CTERM motif